MSDYDEIIKISVRSLVEFLMRSGDIDNRRTSQADVDAMQAGSRMHRKIQNSMGPEYTPEVSLKIEIPTPKYALVIEGRADGIICQDNEPVTIDEIKGVYQNLEHLTEPVPVHLGQAKCYAYIYAKQHQLDVIRIQMTYCNLDTEEIKYFTNDYSFAELDEWFTGLITECLKWTDFRFDWKKKHLSSIGPLEFPYAYRDGQKQLVSDVYRTILRRKNLFIQAPTGAGKTIATVFPAVKAVGKGHAERIFYLTAKTVTGQIAFSAFSLLKKHGYESKIIQLTAKEKMCLCDEVECNPVRCPLAKGHFDRINGALFALLTSQSDYTREMMLDHALAHQVCPFEMSLDISSFCDDIICDYNYVFDPHVALKRFFADGISGSYLFLVDEAHNLVERAREMYSATMHKERFLEVKHYMRLYSKPIEKELTKCNKIMLAYKRECDDYAIMDTMADFQLALKRLEDKIENFLQKNIEFKEKKDFLDFYFEVRDFVDAYDRIDDHYLVYTEHSEQTGFFAKIFCVDPSRDLQQRLDKANSTIFFSATFLPIGYYKSLLSTKSDNYAVYAKSAFDPSMRLLAIGRDVSSKYTRRTADEYERIADYLGQMVAGKKGNYMAFFPSYKMMEEVAEIFIKKYHAKEYTSDEIMHTSIDNTAADEIKTIFEATSADDTLSEKIAVCHEDDILYLMQRSHMSEAKREEFLAAFESGGFRTLLGFCVMGGIFGEGIDLTSDRLIGAAVIGTGIPQISNERQMLCDYFDEKNGHGFDYAYRYPGMNKVQQAAGRVIRTTEDRGVVLLLDERFLARANLEIFPRSWSQYQVVDIQTVGETVTHFWNSTEI